MEMTWQYDRFGDVAGHGGSEVAGGHAGRMIGQMTSLGGGGKRFLGAPPSAPGGFGEGGSTTPGKVMRGGSTASTPPISRMLTFGRLRDGKDPPAVDLGWAQFDGWR